MTLMYFNALSGNVTISTGLGKTFNIKDSHEPQNKVLSIKGIFISFLSSFLSSLAAFNRQRRR